MTTGFDWDEWTYSYSSDQNPVGQMFDADDPIQFVLDREMEREPGTRFAYCSGASMLLGEIIEIVSGIDVLAFARRYLFTPIGIGDLYWWKDYWKDISYFSTEGGLYMIPRDMAKFGYLMLNNGSWDGEQVVSQSWVNASTNTQLIVTSIRGYGFQWWTATGSEYWAPNFKNTQVFYAMGMDGQKIYVIPEYDIVVVMTGHFERCSIGFYDNMVSDIIIESILLYQDDSSSENDSHLVVTEWKSPIQIKDKWRFH
jgi:CubicO group peptidase (beta-lactamase class C family)